METLAAIAFVLAVAATTISWITGQNEGGGRQDQSAADADFCEVREGILE